MKEQRAGVPEWSKGVDSSSTAQASWVQIPPPAIFNFGSTNRRGKWPGLCDNALMRPIFNIIEICILFHQSKITRSFALYCCIVIPLRTSHRKTL